MQRALLAFIGLLFCLPLLLFRSSLAWSANRPLAGSIVATPPVPLSRVAWFDGSFQNSAALRFGETMPIRPLLVRANNQWLWSLFRKSYMYGEGLVEGRRGNLYKTNFIAFRNRLAPHPTDPYLGEMAAQAASLQRLLAARRVPFAVFITPDKPSIFPEDLPVQFNPNPRGQPMPPRDAERLIAALRHENVTVVDVRRQTADLRASAPWPVFARTGIHWTRPAAAAAANTLFRALGPSLPQLTAARLWRDRAPEGDDADLALGLNLLRPPGDEYVHAAWQAAPVLPGVLTVIGGSFLIEINDVLEQTGAFDQINYYVYFNVGVRRPPDHPELNPVVEDQIPWGYDFLCARAVVLEINPMQITGRHAPAFLAAALRGLAREPADLPVTPVFNARDWWAEESSGGQRWRWAREAASITLLNPNAAARRVRLACSLDSRAARHVRLLDEGGAVLQSVFLERPAALFPLPPLEILAPPGATALRFAFDGPAAAPPSPADPRKVSIRLCDFAVVAAK